MDNGYAAKIIRSIRHCYPNPPTLLGVHIMSVFMWSVSHERRCKKICLFRPKKTVCYDAEKFGSKARSFHWDELREYTVIDSSRMHDEVYRRGLIEELWRDYNMEIRAYCLARLHEGLAEEV